MNKDKKFRVFTDDVHEYNIEINKNKDGYDTYALVRTGKTWSESASGQTTCTMTNDGNGYHVTGVDDYMDYAEIMELQILLQFVSWYESKDSKHSSVITIQSCKEKVRFTI
jgi:hypothetical protein